MLRDHARRGKGVRPFRYAVTAFKTTKVKLCRDAVNNKSTQYILHKKNVVAGYTPILGRGAIQYTRFPKDWFRMKN